MYPSTCLCSSAHRWCIHTCYMLNIYCVSYDTDSGRGLLQHENDETLTLQHIATRCSTLQRNATHCNSLQLTATYCHTDSGEGTTTWAAKPWHCNTLRYTVTHWTTLKHTARQTQAKGYYDMSNETLMLFCATGDFAARKERLLREIMSVDQAIYAYIYMLGMCVCVYMYMYTLYVYIYMYVYMYM